MRLYRVSYLDSVNGHDGHGWFRTRPNAEKAVRTYKKEHKDAGETIDARIDEVDFPLTKRGVVELLNAYAGHPNNG